MTSSSDPSSDFDMINHIFKIIDPNPIRVGIFCIKSVDIILEE